MSSKNSIDRYCKTRTPLNVAAEKKRFPRNESTLETRRAKQDFLKNNTNLSKTGKEIFNVDSPRCVHSDLASPMAPVLSPETSIVLDNAERVAQNALLEIEHLNVTQPGDRVKGGIRFRIYEPSFEDEDDQLLYVRERVAAKLYAIDNGIEPEEETRNLKDNAYTMFDFTSKSDPSACKLKSLCKNDGQSFNRISQELKTSREDDKPETTDDCFSGSRKSKKSVRIDESKTVKQHRFPDALAQKKLEGFSIEAGPSVTIERELKAQRLQDIHISPDSSFIQNMPNVRTYEFQYLSGSRNNSQNNRKKFIKIPEESYETCKEKNNELKEIQTNVYQDNVPTYIKSCSENEKSTIGLEVSKTDTQIPHRNESRLSSICIKEKSINSTTELHNDVNLKNVITREGDVATKIDDDEGNYTIPIVRKDSALRNFYSSKSSLRNQGERSSKDQQLSMKKSLVHIEDVVKDNSLENKEEEIDICENGRRNNIEIHFKNIFENYSDRKTSLLDVQNASDMRFKFADPSFEGMMPASNEVHLYEPSTVKLDTVINAYNKAIKRIVRGVRTVDQFLSGNKIAQYRNVENKMLDERSRASLLATRQDKKADSKSPSVHQKRRAQHYNLIHKEKECSRNKMNKLNTGLKLRQTKAPMLYDKFPVNDCYRNTNISKGPNNPKIQLKYTSMTCESKNTKYESLNRRGSFTDITNSLSEVLSSHSSTASISTNHNVQVQDILKNKTDLLAASQSKIVSDSQFKSSIENREHKESEPDECSAVVCDSGATVLRELVSKLKDSRNPVDCFHLQNIEHEKVKKYFETELAEKKMDPEIIRSVIKNLEGYARDLEVTNNDPADSNVTDKDNSENNVVERKKDGILPSIIQHDRNSLEKDSNESQASQSLHSDYMNSIRTITEENLSNKGTCENKNDDNDSCRTSPSRKKSGSLPIHESSRVDNKVESINSDVKSFEEISIIKPNRSSYNEGSLNVRETDGAPINKKLSSLMDIKSLKDTEQNLSQIKPVSESDQKDISDQEVKNCDNRAQEDAITKQDSCRDYVREQVSTSANSLRDSSSLSASLNSKHNSHKSVIKTPGSPNSDLDKQSGKVSSTTSEKLCESKQNIIADKQQDTKDEKYKPVDTIRRESFKAQVLSDASHSEGEICMSSSCSFSLGEVRGVKTDSTSRKTNGNEICVVHTVQNWNELTDSEGESPGEFSIGLLI